MKKFLFFALITLLAVACKPDEPKKPFQISAYDMISIKPAAQTATMRAPAESGHLSALEIVEQTTLIVAPGFVRSFHESQRDTESNPPRLLMWATDVISLEGKLLVADNFEGPMWIDSRDIVFERYSTDSSDPNNVIDTIAYIPNAVLQAAEVGIRAAYEAQDIEECYRLFNEAYTFVPITGSEWRALKSQGLN